MIPCSDAVHSSVIFGVSPKFAEFLFTRNEIRFRVSFSMYKFHETNRSMETVGATMAERVAVSVEFSAGGTGCTEDILTVFFFAFENTVKFFTVAPTVSMDRLVS